MLQNFHLTQQISSFNPLQVQTKPKYQFLEKMFYANVSIPYRYKQNGTTCVVVNVFNPGFNPLQVQTKHNSGMLLGHWKDAFQSPIGTNKTTNKNAWKPRLNQVSIPYRYKQNWRDTFGVAAENLRFNPLQVQTKPFIELPLVVVPKVSIPYRYKQNFFRYK